MPIDKKTIEYVAHLSRIKLCPEELDKMSLQLKAILDFIDKLKNVDITGIRPMSHILPISNVLRDDELKDSLPTFKVLENSQLIQDNFFVVPKVIE